VHPVAGDGWPEQLNAENLGLSEKRRFGGETPFRARNVMVALGGLRSPTTQPYKGRYPPKAAVSLPKNPSRRQAAA
jgi:hypothetical protein